MLMVGYGQTAVAPPASNVEMSAIEFAKNVDGLTYTSGSVTLQNRPLFIAVMCLETVGTQSKTVTLSNGSTSVPQVSGPHFRSPMCHTLHFVVSPPAGSTTVTVTGTTTMNEVVVLGFYVDGATGIGAVGVDQATTSALAVDVTTTATNREVLYIGSMYGEVTSPALSGATTLRVLRRPGADLVFFSAFLGWEDAPTVLQYIATMNSGGSNNGAIGYAVEVA